jgi:heat shock protein HtpX
LIIAVAGLLGGGSQTAVLVGTGFAFVTIGTSYWLSDRIALRAARARVVERDEAPELWDAVAELSAAAGMSMPRVALTADAQPNAFATGRNEANAVVCATSGLLSTLSRDELRGVVAHELAHIRNRDILIGSVAAAIASAVSSIAQMAYFASVFSGNDEDRPNPLVVLLVSLLAPISATLIQLAVSRTREFEADAAAAALLGAGRPLADALRRIEDAVVVTPMAARPEHASAWIANPVRGRGVARLFSTHPSTEERIARLLAL